jgi:hypothetical protein
MVKASKDFFFEKKEPGRRAAKKLSVLRARAPVGPMPAGPKVFWFFFSKKNFFALFKFALRRRRGWPGQAGP